QTGGEAPNSGHATQMKEPTVADALEHGAGRWLAKPEHVPAARFAPVVLKGAGAMHTARVTSAPIACSNADTSREPDRRSGAPPVPMALIPTSNANTTALPTTPRITRETMSSTRVSPLSPFLRQRLTR